MKIHNYLITQIRKFQLMTKLLRQISKNKTKKLVKESNPKTRFYSLFITKETPKLKVVQISRVCEKRDFNWRPPQTVRRSNDEPSTSSVDKYLASYLSLHFASSLIKLKDQQHDPLIHLLSVDASRRSILRFPSTSSTGHCLIKSMFC